MDFTIFDQLEIVIDLKVYRTFFVSFSLVDYPLLSFETMIISTSYTRDYFLLKLYLIEILLKVLVSVFLIELKRVIAIYQ